MRVLQRTTWERHNRMRRMTPGAPDQGTNPKVWAPPCKHSSMYVNQEKEKWWWLPTVQWKFWVLLARQRVQLRSLKDDVDEVCKLQSEVDEEPWCGIKRDVPPVVHQNSALLRPWQLGENFSWNIMNNFNLLWTIMICFVNSQLRPKVTECTEPPSRNFQRSAGM